ncbi:MAG: SOS response-associated peptidase [bacterium]|nr:SOS response-associated peptidase [bacterium]
MMCGRFVLTADPATIQQHFDLTTVPTQMSARYNVAPTQPVAVISNDNHRELTFYRWGLIPSWAKDMAIGNQMINARSETVEEKPAFRAAFKRRRCLIPANGFYEWAKDGKAKKPMFVHLKNQELFAFAGLWEIWHSPDGGEIRSCTILTSEPNDLISPLHNRMAVILDKSNYDLWLSKDELPPEVLKPLLRPYDENKMDVFEVSTLVNSPANDLPECIVPLSATGQASLL